MAKKSTSARRTRSAARTGRAAKRSQARRRAVPARAKGRTKARAAKRLAKPRRPARRRSSVAKPAVRRPPALVAKPSGRGAAAPSAFPGQPTLERARRLLPEAERLNAAKDMTDDRMMAAARSGREELKAQLHRHTESSPALTAGDIDAKWEDAYAVGDEAPGGDNPTPGQDRVDDIGKALGVQYQDNEELQGGDEITERDHQRWELDPASSDDWPHKE